MRAAVWRVACGGCGGAWQPPRQEWPPCGSLQEKGRRKETGSEYRDGRLASEGHGNKNTARHVSFPKGPPMHSRSGCSSCWHVQELVLKFSPTQLLQWLQCGCSCQSAVCGEICRLPSRCTACYWVCAASLCHSKCDVVIMLSGHDIYLISRQARSVTSAHNSSTGSENPSGAAPFRGSTDDWSSAFKLFMEECLNFFHSSSPFFHNVL